MAATWANQDMYNVHIVTPIVKIVTFVSISRSGSCRGPLQATNFYKISVVCRLPGIVPSKIWRYVVRSFVYVLVSIHNIIHTPIST